jgi:hypothetical protein
MRALSKRLKTKLFGLLGELVICALGFQLGAAATMIFVGTSTGSDGALAASVTSGADTIVPASIPVPTQLPLPSPLVLFGGGLLGLAVLALLSQRHGK